MYVQCAVVLDMNYIGRGLMVTKCRLNLQDHVQGAGHGGGYKI